jgi:hypothetical protein
MTRSEPPCRRPTENASPGAGCSSARASSPTPTRAGARDGAQSPGSPSPARGRGQRRRSPRARGPDVRSAPAPGASCGWRSFSSGEAAPNPCEHLVQRQEGSVALGRVGVRDGLAKLLLELRIVDDDRLGCRSGSRRCLRRARLAGACGTGCGHGHKGSAPRPDQKDGPWRTEGARGRSRGEEPPARDGEGRGAVPTDRVEVAPRDALVVRVGKRGAPLEKEAPPGSTKRTPSASRWAATHRVPPSPTRACSRRHHGTARRIINRTGAARRRPRAFHEEGAWHVRRCRSAWVARRLPADAPPCARRFVLRDHMEGHVLA